MNKIIISFLAILVLTSCGTKEDVTKKTLKDGEKTKVEVSTVKTDTPEKKVLKPKEVLTQNQLSIIKVIENKLRYYPENGNSKGNINLDLGAKEGKLNVDITYNSDYKENWIESSSDLKVKLNAKPSKLSKAPVEEISWDLDINLILLKTKVLFKLNSLNLKGLEKIPQATMIPMVVSQFQNKWYFQNTSREFSNYLKTQKGLMTGSKIAVKAIKDNNLLKLIKENKDKNFYNYDVKISDQAIINIWKEIVKITATEKEKQTIPEEKIKEIKDSISKFNKESTINIKIDKSNLENFSLTIKSTKEGEDTEIKIENTKTNFNISLKSIKKKIDIKFVWIKSENKLDWTIIAMTENKEIFNGTLFSSYIDWKTNFILKWKAKNKWEELDINFTISDKTIKKDITIKEPKEATNIMEAMWQMGALMGWTTPPTWRIQTNNNQEKIELKTTDS